MPKVILSIPELGVTEKGWETNKEIYVISFAADLNITGKPKMSDVIAAYNETLPNVVPSLQNEAALQYLLVSVSNTFTRIRPDQPVSLSGSGILLYPNFDPKGLLASHFIIVESDQETRDISKLLKTILGDESIISLVANLAKGITQPLLALLMNAVISQVPKALVTNQDDILFSHSHSGFEFDNYGCDHETKYTNFKLGNDLAYCTLRVRVNE